MNKDELELLIQEVNSKTKISSDILEKDYYVCLVLNELAKKQDVLKAYFKGGTAVYKILDTINRFSEDIDLTVKVIDTDSKTSNVNRLKKSAFGYNIPTLELMKDKTIDKKGSVTSFYKYDSLFLNSNLCKKNMVQIEATSFTVSEPTKIYNIEPLIYKFATEEEKEKLKSRYGISNFDIEVISLERIFIDKIFAIEFYYIREDYVDVAKHLYDITILFNNDDIKKMLDNKEELLKLISYKRMEEEVRIGGIDKTTKIKDFRYFNEDFNDELIKSFDRMQDIFVFDDTYRISIDMVKETINSLKQIFTFIE